MLPLRRLASGTVGATGAPLNEGPGSPEIIGAGAGRACFDFCIVSPTIRGSRPMHCHMFTSPFSEHDIVRLTGAQNVTCCAMIMYPLVEETAAWQRGSKEHPSMLTLGPAHRALMCMAIDSKLQGVGFIGEYGDWKHEGDGAYSISIPRMDILEAVYADTKNHNPRLCFGMNVVTVPIEFGEELSLPVVAVQYHTIRLLVDAVPLNDEGAVSLPCVRLRMASLTHEGRRQTVEESRTWRTYIIKRW